MTQIILKSLFRKLYNRKVMAGIDKDTDSMYIAFKIFDKDSESYKKEPPAIVKIERHIVTTQLRISIEAAFALNDILTKLLIDYTYKKE